MLPDYHPLVPTVPCQGAVPYADDY
jgi:hypothetical protein